MLSKRATRTSLSQPWLGSGVGAWSNQACICAISSALGQPFLQLYSSDDPAMLEVVHPAAGRLLRGVRVDGGSDRADAGDVVVVAGRRRAEAVLDRLVGVEDVVAAQDLSS